MHKQLSAFAVASLLVWSPNVRAETNTVNSKGNGNVNFIGDNGTVNNNKCENGSICNFIVRDDPPQPVLPPVSQPVKNKSYQLSNTSRRTGQNRWNWQARIDASDGDLSQIAYVDYLLHPSFSQRSYRASFPQNNFALNASGWGEFDLKATITFKDGTTEQLNHRLQLFQPTAPIQPAPTRFAGIPYDQSY